MKLSRAIPVLLIASACATWTQHESDDDWRLLPMNDAQRRRVLAMSPLGEPPPDPTNRVADDGEAAEFGQALFFDPRLSSSGTVSCATCHDPQKAFSNGKQFGEGIKQTQRHVPTLLNVAHLRWFYWDGRADTLWAQALQPIEHEDEMGFDRVGLARLIAREKRLRMQYEVIFGDLPAEISAQALPTAAKPAHCSPDDPRHRAWLTMTDSQQAAVNRVFANVGKALAAYQRRLQPERSPFDMFLEGLRDGDRSKQRALSISAQRGLQLFFGEANCHLCHRGPLLSDQTFHNIGVPLGRADGWQDAGRFDAIRIVSGDPFNAAGRYSDDPSSDIARRLQTLRAIPDVWGAFKTPSLRSVARTAPYMHHGQLATLEDVVRFYSSRENAIQVGHHVDPLLQPLNLSEQQIADLVAFLESLSSPPLPDRLCSPPRETADR